MTDFIRELSSPSRRMILSQLLAGPKSVNEIVQATGLKQPNVSNHLAKLRSKLVLRATRSGRQVFYSLANPEVESTVRRLVDERPQGGPVIAWSPAAAQQYAEAAVRGDEQTCTRIVDGLLAQAVPVSRVYHLLFGEAMECIGKWFGAGEVDEGQEHLASAITERLMGRAMQFSSLPVASARTVVLGCCSGNWHSIGLRMISDLMRLNGWRTVYLGASVPVRSFLSAIAEHKPAVVMVSCVCEDSVPECLRLLAELRRHAREGYEFLIGVGGWTVNHRPQEFLHAGADFTAPNVIVFAEEALPLLESRYERVSGAYPNGVKTGSS